MKFGLRTKGALSLASAPSEKLDFNRFRNRIHPEDRESVLKAVENSLGPARNIDLSTGRSYQMGNCAGSSGEATSS